MTAPKVVALWVDQMVTTERGEPNKQNENGSMWNGGQGGNLWWWGTLEIWLSWAR